MNRYVLTTPSTDKCVTVEEIKRQGVWPESDDSRDADWDLAISAATSYVEGIAGVSLRDHIWTLYTDDWPDGELELKYGAPALTVTSVKYYPADGGALATLDAAEYTVSTELGIIIFDGDTASLYSRPDAVQIQFQATIADYGVAMTDECKILLKMAAVEFFENPANAKDDLWKLSDRILASFRPYI